MNMPEMAPKREKTHRVSPFFCTCSPPTGAGFRRRQPGRSGGHRIDAPNARSIAFPSGWWADFRDLGPFRPCFCSTRTGRACRSVSNDVPVCDSVANSSHIFEYLTKIERKCKIDLHPSALWSAPLLTNAPMADTAPRVFARLSVLEAECRPGDEGGAYLHTAIFFRIVSLPETEAASDP